MEPGVHLTRRTELKMTDRTSVVADFWLAVARNNHDEAQNAMCRLDVPIVSISLAYSFEMVDGEERLAEVEQEDTGALVGPVRGVMPDTPTSTVVAWNAEVGVLLVVKNKITTIPITLITKKGSTRTKPPV